MKAIGAYIFLFGWLIYLFSTTTMYHGEMMLSTLDGQNSILHHNNTSPEEPLDCCSKMHPEKKEANSNHCSSENQQPEKDCCANNSCAMVCCNVLMVGIVSNFDPFVQQTHFPIDIHFHTPQPENLPNPFIGIDFPPPNC